MFALLITVACAHYYYNPYHQSHYSTQPVFLSSPRQYGAYGMGGGMPYGMMTQGTFNLDPRGTAVFHDGIDSKPAGMFIAAGFDPTYLPMMTDGVDNGDAWIYGLPNMSKEQVIAEAKRRYPVSAATGIPENEELMPVWTQITANCLLVDNSRNPNCAPSTTTDGTTTDGTTTDTTDGTTADTTVTTDTSSDPAGTMVLKAGLYKVLAEGESSDGSDGATILTPGTYRFGSSGSSGASSSASSSMPSTTTANTGTMPMIYHYGGEEPEYEYGEMAEIGGLRLRSPRHLSYYGCPPQDYVLGVGCIPNLRMRIMGRRNL